MTNRLSTLAIVVSLAALIASAAAYVGPEETEWFATPVHINTAPDTWERQGMVGIGNEATIDGDAVFFVKHTFYQHGGQTPNGVGNVHGVNSAIRYINTEQDHAGLIISAPSRVVLGNGNTKDLLGLFAATQHLVQIEQGSAGYVARAVGGWADLEVNSPDVTIGEYDGFVVRGVTGLEPNPQVQTFRGFRVNGHARATESAIGLSIGALDAPYSRAIVLDGIGPDNAVQFGANGPVLYSDGEHLYIDGQRVLTEADVTCPQ